MKAIYTDAAKRELEAFQTRQQEMLESVVAERKLVLGDDVLEITASDIKSASEKIQVYRPPFIRNRSSEIVMRMYIVIGVAMMTGALYYPQLMEIFTSNRTQALIFVMGAFMAVMGGVFSYWIRTRQRRIFEELTAYSAIKRSQKLDVKNSSTGNQTEV